MPCKKIQAPKFTKKQLEECYKCKMISGRKKWCGHFGVWVIEHGKILTPNRKIKYPSKRNMAKTLTAETIKYNKAGRPKRSEAEQAKLMTICKKCEHFVAETKLGPRCEKCGCCMNIKKRWATAHCPLKPAKW